MWSRRTPAVDLERVGNKGDDGHLVAVIPPTYAVSAIVGKVKANASRAIHERFPKNDVLAP